MLFMRTYVTYMHIHTYTILLCTCSYKNIRMCTCAPAFPSAHLHLQPVSLTHHLHSFVCMYFLCLLQLRVPHVVSHYFSLGVTHGLPRCYNARIVLVPVVWQPESDDRVEHSDCNIRRVSRGELRPRVACVRPS